MALELNQRYKLPSVVQFRVFTKFLLVISLISFPFSIPEESNFFEVFLGFSFLGSPFLIYYLLKYHVINFVVNEDKITINKGIVIKRSSSISFDKVQNVETTRRILDTPFKLLLVKIWTASPEQINIKIRKSKHKSAGELLILKEDAKWLKNYITDKK